MIPPVAVRTRETLRDQARPTRPTAAPRRSSRRGGSPAPRAPDAPSAPVRATIAGRCRDSYVPRDRSVARLRLARSGSIAGDPAPRGDRTASGAPSRCRPPPLPLRSSTTSRPRWSPGSPSATRTGRAPHPARAPAGRRTARTERTGRGGRLRPADASFAESPAGQARTPARRPASDPTPARPPQRPIPPSADARADCGTSLRPETAARRTRSSDSRPDSVKPVRYRAWPTSPPASVPAAPTAGSGEPSPAPNRCSSSARGIRRTRSARCPTETDPATAAEARSLRSPPRSASPGRCSFRIVCGSPLVRPTASRSRTPCEPPSHAPPLAAAATPAPSCHPPDRRQPPPAAPESSSRPRSPPARQRPDWRVTPPSTQAIRHRSEAESLCLIEPPNVPTSEL
jgi:hypothetical protein